MHVVEFRGTYFRKIFQERESLRGKKKSLVVAHQVLRQEGNKRVVWESKTACRTVKPIVNGDL